MSGDQTVGDVLEGGGGVRGVRGGGVMVPLDN